MRFGHIALRIKKVEEMLNYYCVGLGFEEAFRIMNDDGSLRIVYVHIGNKQYLELCLGGQERVDFNDTTSIGFRHICFVVENLAKTKMEMESRGVIFDSEIMKARDKNLSAYLFDPDGNKIELVEISKESQHYQFENNIK